MGVGGGGYTSNITATVRGSSIASTRVVSVRVTDDHYCEWQLDCHFKQQHLPRLKSDHVAGPWISVELVLEPKLKQLDNCCLVE